MVETNILKKLPWAITRRLSLWDDITGEGSKVVMDTFEGFPHTRAILSRLHSRVVKVLVRYADFFPTFSNVLVPLQDYGMSYGLILLFI